MMATLKKSFIFHSPEEKNCTNVSQCYYKTYVQTYLLAERILLGLRSGVVVVEGLLEDLGGEAHVFCERLAGLVALHEAAADVVLAVPFDLLPRSAVEDKADGELWGA